MLERSSLSWTMSTGLQMIQFQDIVLRTIDTDSGYGLNNRYYVCTHEITNIDFNKTILVFVYLYYTMPPGYDQTLANVYVVVATLLKLYDIMH